MPIFGVWKQKLFLLVKRKYTIGSKYFLAKWGCILYVVNVFFFYQYNNLKKFLNSIQSLDKPRGRHNCLCYLSLQERWQIQNHSK